MPAASASSRVVVPPKPLRANSGIAASTILCRRSSLSSRVAAMMRQSKRSLTLGQYIGLRQKRWPKKMGGLPPKAAQSAMWQWPSTPISGRDARHTQEGRSGISPSGATAKSPINRAIHDNRHLRPLSRERSPALCTFRLWAPRFWRLDSEQPRCIFAENSAPRRMVEPSITSS